MAGTLRARELRLVNLIAGLVVTAERRVDSVDAGLMVSDFLALCGPGQVLAFRGALVFIELCPFLFQIGPRGSSLPRATFSGLPEQAQKRVIRRLETARTYTARSLWKLVKILIYFTYYKQPEVLRSFGYDPDERRARARRLSPDGTEERP